MDYTNFVNQPALNMVIEMTIVTITLFYCGVMVWIIAGFDRLKRTRYNNKPDLRRQLAVVIPFRNEFVNLQRLIPEVRRWEEVEVIFVDDHSVDHSRQLLEQELGQCAGVRIIANDGEGKKEALQSAARSSAAEYLVFTDADCRHGDQWLSRIREIISTSPSGLMVLPVTTTKANTLSGKLQELDFLSLITATFGSYRKPFMCNGANLVVNREVFLRIELYAGNQHIPSGDDVFLLHAMKRRSSNAHKITFHLDTELWVHTAVKKDWAGFFEQRARWGSKTINYTDRWTLFMAILVLLASLMMVGLPLLLISGKVPVLFGTLFLGIKLTVDTVLLIKGSLYFKKPYLIPLILPASVLYVLYVPVIALWGVLRNLTKFRR